MRFTILLTYCLAIVFTVKISTICSKDVNHFEYPIVRRNESVVDDYHGIKVSDPYRWLEDPDSEETKQFVEAENKRYDQEGKTDGSETVTNKNQKLYYHRVGESQDDDVLVAEFPEHPAWLISAIVSDGGKYLIVVTIEIGHDNSVFYADLEKNGPITGKIPLTPIITAMDADYGYVTNTGTKIVFHTNKDAPNYRVIEIDLKNSTKDNWNTLIEEHPKDVLNEVQCVDKDKLIVHYSHDVKSVLQVHSLETGEVIRKFPLEIGQLAGLSLNKRYSEMFYRLDSFLSPGIIYRYDFATPDIEPTVFREVKLNLDGFDKRDFKVEQVFYPSRDGTKIPMFIVQKNTVSKTAKPSHVYFTAIVFNGIFALPNIRGGGEYGITWYDGGRLFNKQNGIDDFQAAAKYLVNHAYTEHKQIAIHGDSNGGLLVGASINQAPELFGAAIAQVGVMDLLRFHKFTIGHVWISDYGNPDIMSDFENVYKFSPLHNVRSPNNTESQYPSTLLLTADHDDRVSPLHSLKFAATLQHIVRENQFQTNPILLRVYVNTGHGGGKPTFKIIEEDTDIMSFLYQTLQIDANF